MLNQELKDYIRQQLEMGMKKEEISRTLLDKTWLQSDIDEAYDSIVASTQEATGPASKLVGLQPEIVTVSIMKKIDTLLNCSTVSERMKIFLLVYTKGLLSLLTLFIVSLGWNYIVENIYIDNDFIAVIIFAIKYFIAFAVYIGFIIIVFFTIVTSAILFILTLVTKVFHKNNQTLLEIILVRLEEIVTFKRYWFIYIVMIFVFIILADNNMLGLSDFF